MGVWVTTVGISVNPFPWEFRGRQNMAPCGHGGDFVEWGVG